MTTSYSHRKTVSITLDLEVYDDFNYKSIDFSSLLELEGNETVEVSITDHSNVDVYWLLSGLNVPIDEVSTKLNISSRMLYSWFINTKGILFNEYRISISWYNSRDIR